MLEIFLITAVCLLLYHRAFSFGLIIDDDRWYQSLKGGWPKITKDNFFHSIKTRLYGGATLGLNPARDHVLATALHALACVLLYFALGRNEVSFMAAILYACNPANNQTAIWLNGRRYQVVVIMTLLMIWLGPWALPLYLAGLSMQITGIFAPIVLGPWGILVILAVFGYKRRSIEAFFKNRLDGIVNEDQRKFAPKRLIVVVKTFGWMVIKMIFPGRTMMIYRFLIGWGMNEQGNKQAYAKDAFFWAGAALLAGAAVVPFFIHGRDVWFFAFFMMATLQCCNFMIANQNVADRYLSLPNTMAMYFLAKGVMTLSPWHDTVFAAIATYYAVNLQITMSMYKDLDAYYDYHNFYCPENAIPRRDQIMRYIQAGMAINALPLIQVALKHNPKDFTTLVLASKCLQMLGDPKASELYVILAEQNQYINQSEYHKVSLETLHRVNKKMMEGKK